MNTPVKFELAKLLKEKGFDKNTLQWYHRETKKLNTNDLMFSMNKLTDNYSAPTIAEVIMWLYEEKGIWISVEPFIKQQDNTVVYIYKIFKNGFVESISRGYTGYNLPNEAYEAAIDYVLNNLI